MTRSECRSPDNNGQNPAYVVLTSGYSEDLRRRLGVRYVQLYFELEFLEGGQLPVYKSSALRGGMGEMLLNAFCFRDRNCGMCAFEAECIVRRIMYARYLNRPEFVTSGESIGYLISCEDYRSSAGQGDILTFTLTLFGKLIVYLNPILQAFAALGQAGLGKNHIHFVVRRVFNSRKEIVVENNWVYWERYKVETLTDYVDYRIRQMNRGSSRRARAQSLDDTSNLESMTLLREECISNPNLRLKIKTPVTLKHNGVLLENLDLEVMIDALTRRLYMLDMFEGITGCEQRDFDMPAGMVLKEIQTVVPRFSSTHGRQIRLRGVRGEFAIEDVCGDALAVLLAGEVMHVGKNVSMGFGKIQMEYLG